MEGVVVPKLPKSIETLSSALNECDQRGGGELPFLKDLPSTAFDPSAG
jgi:hypothetical protein